MAPFCTRYCNLRKGSEPDFRSGASEARCLNGPIFADWDTRIIVLDVRWALHEVILFRGKFDLYIDEVGSRLLHAKRTRALPSLSRIGERSRWKLEVSGRVHIEPLRDT